MTGAEVSLASAEISATDGVGALKGLHLRNPNPFTTDALLRLGEVRISIDPTSIGSDVIRIREIMIDQPQVTYELSGQGSNIDAVQKNIDSYVKKMGGAGTTASSGDKAAPKLVIDRLVMKGGQIRVGAQALGGRTLDAPLPLIEIKDIGKEKSGATPGEVAQKILASLEAAVGKGTAGLNLGALTGGAADLAKGAADALKSGAGGALEKLPATAPAVSDAVGKGLQGADNTLRNLLGGQK